MTISKRIVARRVIVISMTTLADPEIVLEKPRHFAAAVSIIGIYADANTDSHESDRPSKSNQS
jgi:hypothetical protein